MPGTSSKEVSAQPTDNVRKTSIPIEAITVLKLYRKGQENTKDLHEKTFFGGFWAEIKKYKQKI